MRLAILNITGGGISGGYRKYLTRILPLFEEVIGNGKILCAAPSNLPLNEWFSGLSRTEFTECKPFSPFPCIRDSLLITKLNAFSPNVVFVPLERYFNYPGVPFVIMLVNMAPMAKNYSVGSLLEKIRQHIQLYNAKIAIRKSTHIIVTSKFVRSFLIDNLGIHKNKISVIYPGADSQKGLIPIKPAIMAEKAWNQFFCTIGSLEMYRGIEDILGALLAPGAKDMKLVICVSIRPQMTAYAHKLKTEISRKGLGGRVLWLEGLSERELAWCYKYAIAYIMTSRIEAGPNTAIEAMSFGAVSIAAGNPPLPEFFAETALYYSPGDSTALAAKMAEVLSWDKEKREGASRCAYARAKLFTWEYAAKKTMDIFQNLADHQQSV